MAKSVHRYLQSKLESLRDQDIRKASVPSVIVFGAQPSSLVEARMQGLLEGLYFAGRISGEEALAWAAKFRMVIGGEEGSAHSGAEAGDLMPRSISSPVPGPWPADRVIRSIKPSLDPQTYTTGLLTLAQVDLYPEGFVLHWRLELSSRSRSSVLTSQERLGKLPDDLLEFHIARTLLPSLSELKAADTANTPYAVLDMSESLHEDGLVAAATRLRPSPSLASELMVTWAGIRYPIDLARENDIRSGQ